MKKNQLDWLSWEWLIKVMFLLFFHRNHTYHLGTVSAKNHRECCRHTRRTYYWCKCRGQGTSNGTITDFEGNFQLNTEKKGSLVISYIGYVTKEVTIKPTLKIVLAEDTKALDEVVVVGYGTQKRVI